MHRCQRSVASATLRAPRSQQKHRQCNATPNRPRLPRLQRNASPKRRSRHQRVPRLRCGQQADPDSGSQNTTDDIVQSDLRRFLIHVELGSQQGSEVHDRREANVTPTQVQRRTAIHPLISLLSVRLYRTVYRALFEEDRDWTPCSSSQREIA